MTTRPTARYVRWAFVISCLVACTEHEPTLERRGGPLPDAGETPDPPEECDGAGGAGGVPATPVSFCQAEIVLRTVCQRCHQEPPLHGAPFALMTWEDTQQPFEPGKPRWQRMREVVETDFMPPRGIRLEPPVMPLTCEEKSTLLGWLRQCAEDEGGTDCANRNEELLSCD